MILVAPALAGNATPIEIRLQSGTVGLLFTTFTGKKIEPTGATPKHVNPAIKTGLQYRANNEFGKSFLSASEPNTQTGTGNIHCGILRFTRSVK